MNRFTIFILLSLATIELCHCDRSSTDSIQDKVLNPKKVIQLTIKEPSGLTYDNRIGILYTVSDGKSGTISAIAANGRLLKEIQTTSKDLEGITINSTNDTLYVVEEQSRTIVKYTLNGKLIDQTIIPLNLNGPNGLEGIAIHPTTKHIYVVHQKNPKLLIELKPDGKFVTSYSINYADELSGLCVNLITNNLMLISNKSQTLFEMDFSSKLLHSWKIPVDAAEGVAMDPNGLIYVICDQTSKLYIFELN